MSFIKDMQYEVIHTVSFTMSNKGLIFSVGELVSQLGHSSR